MSTVISPSLEAPPRLVVFASGEFDSWLRNRQEWGGDRRDEVWDGVDVVMPSGNNNHQELIGDLTFVLKSALAELPGAKVFPGCNVSDDRGNWTSNYRCRDVAVYLPGNPAENRETHWLGGPDFAVEIVSKYDRSREKFGFYAKAGVRELLFVDRHPTWSLELLRREGEDWISVGMVDPESPGSLASDVLPVIFCLIDAQPHPRIEVARQGTGLRWLA